MCYFLSAFRVILYENEKKGGMTMKRRLMQTLALVLCVSSLLTCQVFAADADDGVMPLWDVVGGAYCEITFKGENGVNSTAVGSVSSRGSGAELYVTLTLYRTHWLFGDTLVNYWSAADYDVVNLGGVFPAEFGKEYKLVMEVTAIYNGYEENLTFTDNETYNEDWLE